MPLLTVGLKMKLVKQKLQLKKTLKCLSIQIILFSAILVTLIQSNYVATNYVKLGNSSHLLTSPKTLLPSSSNFVKMSPTSANHHRLIKQQHNLLAQQQSTATTPPSNISSSEKICIGTSNGLSAQNNKTDHLHNLAERYKNCTYVMGNLEITRLDRNVDLSFLESIREITGYLLIAHVEVERIRMPNLQIIGGRELFRQSKGETEFALFVLENEPLQQLELPNFREILAGNVGFYYNKNLCHTRINWDEIINWPIYRTDFRYDGAQPECKPCDSACQGFCWGQGPEMCQKFSKTNCAEQCNGGRCFGVGSRECCHLFCAAGCTGPEQTDCLACKTFYNDGECIQECPPMQRYNPNKFLWEHNPLGKYAFGGKCVQECPGHLLRDNGACVRTCPPNKKPNTNGECVPCSGPCQKECQGVDVIHSGNIDQLVNCTVIEGSLTILDSSFSGHTEISQNGTLKEHFKAMHPDKLEVMRNIREITGFLSIQANHRDFKNLSYFRNLQTIGGRQTTDMFYSISIIKTSLVSLNLKSLKKVRSGRIIVQDNKDLCFADTINWQHLNVTKLDDITIRNNADNSKCRTNKLTCHKQCSGNGCWGPEPDECLSCNNYKLEDYCVEDCTSHHTNLTSPNQTNNTTQHLLNSILSYDAGKKTCKRCHQECREGCNGTEAIHCWKCKNVKDGPYCVHECPIHKYIKNGICEECDKSCASGCTGPSNKLGEGGCNACAKTIFVSGNDTNHAYCIRADEPCPEGYYQEYQQFNLNGDSSSMKLLAPGRPVCRKCHHRCKSCTGLGTHVSVCECAKYVAGEQCEDFCPRDYFANEQAGQCVKCSPECNGCFGPSEADCISCRVYRIYEAPLTQDEQIIDLSSEQNRQQPQHQLKFNCTAHCPPNKPHLISESNMLDPYCSEVNPGNDFEASSRITSTWGSVLLIAIASSLIMACFSVYRCQIEKDKTVKLTMHLSGIDDVEPLTPSNLKPNLAPLRSIKETELRKGNILGSGFGGTVYQGFWYPEGNELDKKPRPVAIKVLRDNGQSNMNKEFLDEAYIMASVNHPNLVRLLAVCMTPNQLMLVTQLMPLGCLLEYVKKYKNDIGSKNLLEWCKQIARGMAYLESNRMVHRDLALRNVLLQTCGRALISDFGLAKFLEVDQSEYSHKGGGRLPIRWLAPECIRERKFTHKTDVWAFGVTVWELLTFGKVPFEEYDTKEVPMEIERGARLQQPKYMTVDVYKQLYSCWFYQPEKRPTFSALAQDFSKFARDPSRYLICKPKGIDYKAFGASDLKPKRSYSLTSDNFMCGDEDDEDYIWADEEVGTQSSLEDDIPFSAAAMPPNLTPSTHNRINENRFAFELSKSNQRQSPIAKRFSTLHHLHHHHHHQATKEHEQDNEVFLSNSHQESQPKHLMSATDANNNNISSFMQPNAQSDNFRWHTLSSNSFGQGSEQPTDMYDYLMPSPIVDEQGNFGNFYNSQPYNSSRSTQMLASSQTSETNVINNSQQPPHSAGLVGVNNEEYFLTYVNNVQLLKRKKRQHRNKRKSDSYDRHELVLNNMNSSLDMTDTPSTSSAASTLSSTANNQLLGNHQQVTRCLERTRKLSTSNGNMPQSLV